jgi:hypothetical protein
MKNLKIGLPAALALAVAAALAIAGTASATVLCKSETSPCASRYGAGTEINAHLKTETISKIDATDVNFPTFEIECDESTFNFKTTNEGGATQTVTANTEAFTFGKCWFLHPFSSYTPPVLLKKPTLELHWVSGPNAMITAKGIEFTLRNGSEDCVYGVPGGGSTAIAELKGAKPAQVWLNMELAKLSGFVCPEHMRWQGIYEVTSPNPLYAAAS